MSRSDLPNKARQPDVRLQTRIWQRIVLGSLIGATGSMQRLSRPAAMGFGARLGRLAYRVDKRRRRYADRNLRLAYGNALSAAEREQLIRRVFEQFGKTVVDFLRVPALDNAQINDLVVGADGWEWMESLRNAPARRGFLIITAHLGNFEFLGRWLAANGVPSTAVARDPADPALAAYARRMREFGGNVILSRGTSARELLTRLRRGEVVTLGADQNSGDLMVPFFGVPAGTTTGPAKLALHTGAVLLPAFCVRVPGDHYRMLFLPPIVPEVTDDREADVARLTATINDVVEKVVRIYPDQWLWLHNRWKSAFEEQHRARWPAGYDFDAARALWQGK